MKNLLTILFLFIGTFVFAQKSTLLNVEFVIAQDSVKSSLYKSLIEGCQKSPVNYRINKQLCPVFIDEEGYTFFIEIDEKGFMVIVEIDYD